MSASSLVVTRTAPFLTALGLLALTAGAAAAQPVGCPVSVGVGPFADSASPRQSVILVDGATGDADGLTDGVCTARIRICLGAEATCPDTTAAGLRVSAGGSRELRTAARAALRDALVGLPGATVDARGTVALADGAAVPTTDACVTATVQLPARTVTTRRTLPLRLRADGGHTMRVTVRCEPDGAAPDATCRTTDGPCPVPRPPECGDGARAGTEACDGADAAACPGACRADCTCSPDAPANLATLATAVASSTLTPDADAAMAIDGHVQGPSVEWRSRGEGAGAFLRLTWPSPVRVDRVVLFDRTSRVDNVRGATLLLDDAESVPVGPLPEDGAPLDVMLGARTLLSLTLVLTDVVGANAGLAEVAVLAAPPETPSDPGTPAPEVVGAPGTSSGRTFYVSPTGNDGRAGTTAATAWRSLKKVFNTGRPLQPGDTVVLLDGTYTRSTTGLPSIDCRTGGTARSGTPTAPITIRAANERKAFLQADGNGDALTMQGCSYWKIEGLRGANRDLASGSAWNGHVFEIASSSWVTLRRNLATHPNRTCDGSPGVPSCNAHAFSLEQAHHVLLEENEAYDFHRHGISAFQSRWITVRRCYVNGATGGPTGIIFYGSSDSIIENSIAEKTYGINIAGSKVYDGSAGGYRNRILGTVTLDGKHGTTIRARSFGGPVYPVGDNLVQHSVFARSTNMGVFARGAANTVLDHVTMWKTAVDSGFTIDEDLGEPAPCSKNPQGCSATIRSCLSAGNKIAGGRVKTAVVRSWSVENSRFFQNGSTQFPTSETPTDAAGNIRSSSTAASAKVGLGAGQCLLWPAAGAGLNGAGATILYRYQDGLLTTQPLWDRATGAFPCGAVVPGVNDAAGNACRDVHTRLNVNVNGCPFPAGY